MNLHLDVFEGMNPFQENTYLVHNNQVAHLIDPGFSSASEWNRLQNVLEQKKLQIEAIVLTHGHVDHVIGLQEAFDRFQVPVCMHHETWPFLDHFPQQAMMFGFQADPIKVDPQYVEPSADLRIGSFTYDARYTPGHAPGHLAFYCKEAGWVISGDALFAGSIGRTDLYGGDFQLLEKSIRTQLYTLPDETVVWPGHGPKTTVGRERRSNPFVSDGI